MTWLWCAEANEVSSSKVLLNELLELWIVIDVVEVLSYYLFASSVLSDYERITIRSGSTNIVSV